MHIILYIYIYTESDNGPYEGFSCDDDTPTNLATPRECYLWGLLKGKKYSRRNVTCRMVKERGRSAFANRSFKPILITSKEEN